MLCQSCRNADVSEDEGTCPSCGLDPRGPVKARMTVDHKSRIDDLDAAEDLAGLREMAGRFLTSNPAVSMEAKRRADALYEKQNPFTYSCPACKPPFSTRERKRYTAHLVDEHAYDPTIAEREASKCESGPS
jgi:hypothetical protein